MNVHDTSEESEQLREALLDLARANAREHETSSEAEALLAGLRRLTENPTSSNMFGHFLAVLRGLIIYEDAAILLEHEGGTLRTVASTSARFDEATWTKAEMLTHLSLRRARALFDVSMVPEWRRQAASVSSGVRSALHVLLQEEPTLAILVCTHSQRGFFAERHARVATRFAPLASHALANYAYTRELERLNAQLNQEILDRQRAEELAAMRQVQVMNTAKMAALGEMAGGVAHEINTPLAVVTLHAQQLRDVAGTIDPATLDTRLATIERTSLRIAKIVRGLLAFARDADADPPARVSVKSVLDDTLELCRERFVNHAVELIVDDVPAELMMTCRATQISQALLNLLSNAFDAVVDRSPRWVRVTVEDMGAEGVEIAVTDSGTGMSKEMRSRIFQPFVTTKAVGKGVGLGLSISAALIEGHGGSLSIDPGSKHTRFVVHLPGPGTAESESRRPTNGDG
jgi:C4-dicarboxylate-specific signal transduction histidine kinase